MGIRPHTRAFHVLFVVGMSCSAASRPLSAQIADCCSAEYRLGFSAEPIASIEPGEGILESAEGCVGQGAVVTVVGPVKMYVNFVSQAEVGLHSWQLNVGAFGDLEIIDATLEGTSSMSSPEPAFKWLELVNPPDFLVGPSAVFAAVAFCVGCPTLDPVGTESVLAFTVDGKESAGEVAIGELKTLNDICSLPSYDCATNIETRTKAFTPGRAVGICNKDRVTLDLTLTKDDSVASDFVRCEANGDGDLDIADGIFILNDLFTNVDAPCPAATDCNADGSRDISDAIYAFTFLFVDGPAPPSPYPECGGSALVRAEDCPPLSTLCP